MRTVSPLQSRLADYGEGVQIVIYKRKTKRFTGRAQTVHYIVELDVERVCHRPEPWAIADSDCTHKAWRWKLFGVSVDNSVRRAEQDARLSVHGQQS